MEPFSAHASACALVQRHSTAFAYPCHPARESGITADPLRERIAPFRLLLDEHPACVRRRSGVHREPSDHAIALVDEISESKTPA